MSTRYLLVGALGPGLPIRLPEMGPNGQTFFSSSFCHGMWAVPAQVSPSEGPTAPDTCLEEPRAICCLNPSGWAAVLP